MTNGQQNDQANKWTKEHTDKRTDRHCDLMKQIVPLSYLERIAIL